MSWKFDLDKVFPEVGTPLYLENPYTGSCLPYTVIKVGQKDGKGPKRIQIQMAELIFHGKRYYDTVADEIVPNPTGETEWLSWAPSRKLWVLDRKFAVFGEYKHEPYTD